MKIIDELFGIKGNVNSLEKRGKCVIANIEGKRYVIKKEENTSILDTYNYLKSRDFNHYPKVIFTRHNYNVYEYIDGIKNPIEQKAFDMVGLLSLLHNKTTYYKEMDIDEYKKIYEDTINIINSRINYYNFLIDKIETHMFMSPSEYIIARNISKVFESLNYSKRSIISWYDLVKTKAKKRVVKLYNNADLEHLIRNKDLYLISWNKSINGMPIYDLYNLYERYFNILDFEDLLKHYEEKYPLLEEEKLLFNTIVSVPDIIIFSDDELKNCKAAKKIIDKLYKSEVLTTDKKN